MKRPDGACLKWDHSLLCKAIVEQAISDYRRLRKTDRESVKTKDEGEYGKQEILEFFFGVWGEVILRTGMGFSDEGITEFRKSIIRL